MVPSDESRTPDGDKKHLHSHPTNMSPTVSRGKVDHDVNAAEHAPSSDDMAGLVPVDDIEFQAQLENLDDEPFSFLSSNESVNTSFQTCDLSFSQADDAHDSHTEPDSDEDGDDDGDGDGDGDGDEGERSDAIRDQFHHRVRRAIPRRRNASSYRGDKEENPAGEQSKADGSNWESEYQEDMDQIIHALHSQYLRQPKSTQQILTREACQIFNEYAKHGSQARLAERVLQFLDGGDIVERPVVNTFQGLKMMKMPDGTLRDILTQANVEGFEKSKLGFEALPPLCNAPPEEDEDNRRQRVHGRESTKPQSGQASSQGSFRSSSPRRSDPRSTYPGSNKRRAPAPFIDNDLLTPSRQPSGERNPQKDHVSERPIPTATESGIPRLPERGYIQNYVPDDASSKLSQKRLEIANYLIENNQDSPSPFFPLDESSLPGLPSNIHLPPIPHPQLDHTTKYSCTNDSETNALLSSTIPSVDSDGNAVGLPFDPIDTYFTFPKGTRFPDGTLECINRIFQLSNRAANDYLRYLTIKYTPTTPPPGQVSIPAPPFALFRAGITELFRSKLDAILQGADLDELGMSPSTRSFLRGWYERIDGGELIDKEIAMLARVCGVQSDSVRLFWEEMRLKRFNWDCLRVWISARELESIDYHKAKSLF